MIEDSDQYWMWLSLLDDYNFAGYIEWRAKQK